MNIWILDCAPMSPRFPRWNLGATCVVVEADQGAILVDAGVGLHDHEAPSWVVRLFALDFGLRRNPESTAMRQLARLGIAPRDVRHTVVTHLHFDHAGGLPDFADATVHAHWREDEADLHPRSWIDLARDRAGPAHDPHGKHYDRVDADWLGLEAIRLPFRLEMVLVPLLAHRRGHCGVAIQEGEDWLHQCSDALPRNVEYDVTPAWLNRMVLGSHGPRLRTFALAHPEVRMLAGHMRREVFLRWPAGGWADRLMLIRAARRPWRQRRSPPHAAPRSCASRRSPSPSPMPGSDRDDARQPRLTRPRGW
jgi:glyoxylase-like metal-dependent hydrolase (beta-lactamase superfamily II)